MADVHGLILKAVLIVLVISNAKSLRNQFLLPEVRDDIEWNCVRDIVETFRQKETSLFYSLLTAMADDLAKLLTLNGTYMRNLDVIHIRGQTDEMSSFQILITDKVNHADKYFYLLYRTYGFRSDARYLLIYLGEEGLHEILEHANIGFLQTVIIMDKFGNLHTMESFEKNCGRDMRSELVSNCTALNLTLVEDVYSRKHEQFYGCEVRVLPVMLAPFIVDVNSTSNPGIEPELFKMASQSYNFSVRYMDSKNLSWGQRFEDGRYIRMSERLYNREGDVMFGGFRTNATFLIDFQAGLPYMSSAIAFYVPNGKYVNDWREIVRIFKKYVWLGIACSLVVTSLIFHALTKIAVKMHNRISKRFAFLEAIAILLGRSIHHPKSPSLRVMFISFALFSYIFSSLYENTLLTFLILPSQSKHVNSLAGIFNSGMRFGGIRFAKDVLGYLSSPKYNGWIDCQLSSKCINMTAFGKDIAIVDDTKAVGYYMKAHYNQTTRKLLYKLPDLYTYYIWMIYNKGFPVLDFVDKVTHRCRDNGLISRLIQKYVNRRADPKLTLYHPVTLSQYYLALCLLLGGTTLAFAVFLIEVGYWKLKKMYQIVQWEFRL